MQSNQPYGIVFEKEDRDLIRFEDRQDVIAELEMHNIPVNYGEADS